MWHPGGESSLPRTSCFLSARYSVCVTLCLSNLQPSLLKLPSFSTSVFCFQTASRPFLFVNKGKYYKGTCLNSSCSFFWIAESAVQGKIFSHLIPQIFDQFLCIWTQDARKFARVKELLAMNEELKRARKAFEVDEDKLANEY